MKDPIKLHDLLGTLKDRLPEPLERSIREADITVPPHSPYLTEVILNIARKFSALPPEADNLSPREKRRLFSRARKEDIADSANFPGVSEDDRKYIISRFGVIGARLATPQKDQELLTIVKEAQRETGFPYRIDEVYILDSDMPVGAANGQCKLYLTTDLLRIMPRLPLKAIIGHEMNHMEENVEKSRAIAEGHASFYPSSYEAEHRADFRGTRTEGGVDAMIEGFHICDTRKLELDKFRKKSLAAIRRGLREISPLTYPYAVAWRQEINDHEQMRPKFLRNLLKGPKLLEDKDLPSSHPSSEERIRRLREEDQKGIKKG